MVSEYNGNYNRLYEKLLIGMYITINQICKGFSSHDLWCLSNFELSDLYCSCSNILNQSVNGKSKNYEQEKLEKEFEDTLASENQELMEGL